MTPSLDPITPQNASEMYYNQRREDASHTSLNETIRPGVDLFVEWCETTGILNLNDVRGRELRKFKTWCKNNTDKNKVSLNGVLAVVRRFLVFCVQIDAVSPKLPDKTPISNLPENEEVSYEKPSTEAVEETLQYLRQFEPASRRHVEYAAIEELGNRVGAVRAVDVCDVDLEEHVIKIRHRPEPDHDGKGTPLKNGANGQRNENISADLANLIQRYLGNPARPNVTDKFGRKPLLTTSSGRPTVDTIRRDLYKLTRPCEYAGNCPHDRDTDTCEAVANAHASECPSSHSPHPLRRYSIERQIDEGVPKEVLCDRVDVSVPVLNKHYDTRSEKRKRKQRLKIFEKLFEGYGDADATLNSTAVEALTNDDGMIDPVKLKQLANAEAQTDTDDDTRDSVQAPDRSDTALQDAKQASFDEFSDVTAVGHPIAAPLLGGLIAAAWLPDRFRRELRALTPATEPSPWPTPERTAKGVAAYTVYVGLLTVNLGILGLFPG